MVPGSGSKKKSTAATRGSNKSATATRVQRRQVSLTSAAPVDRLHSSEHQHPFGNQHSANYQRYVDYQPVTQPQPVIIPTEDPLREFGSGIYSSGTSFGYDGTHANAPLSTDLQWEIRSIQNGPHPIQSPYSLQWTHVEPRYTLYAGPEAEGPGLLNTHGSIQPNYGDANLYGVSNTFPGFHNGFVPQRQGSLPPGAIPTQVPLDSSHPDSVSSWNTGTLNSSFPATSSASASQYESYDQTPMDATYHRHYRNQHTINVHGLDTSQAMSNSQGASRPSSSSNQPRPRRQLPPTPSLCRSSRAYKTKPRILCDLCGAVFSREDSCDRHIRAVHGSETFQCSFCDYRYPRKDKLDEHWFEWHREESDTERYRLVRK